MHASSDASGTHESAARKTKTKTLASGLILLALPIPLVCKMSTDLDLAKQRLLEKLGPDYNRYLQLLGKWFRGAISKEEFDESAKQLNKHDFAPEHNRFWLAFFHHCASNASNQTPLINHGNGTGQHRVQMTILNDTTRVKCLPNKVLTHMRIFVTAWELQLDSVDDTVSCYINLALLYFLKNIITELICTKKAYRLRENRFKHAVGVKPINPYLSNSLKVYSNKLEYDPYQIENKMNSSVVDTCIYNDSLFSSRLYELQALYEYACATTSISDPAQPSSKRLTLYHLLIAFITNKKIIPSQILYSLNLERIFTKLSC